MINTSQLEQILKGYKCPCNIKDMRRGGGYIDYILQPLNGTTINRLQSRVNDFTVAIGQAVTISIEDAQLILRLKESAQYFDFFNYYNYLDRKAGQIAIGINPRGEFVQFNLFDMPHLLVAGATGAGKSVFLHNVIVSLLTRGGVCLRLIDLKKVELSMYNGLNRMLSNAITDAATAAAVLESEVEEMQARYELMQRYHVRHFKDLPPHKALNARVIIIDELADLMLNRDTRKSVENSVVRIAQLGRAAGVHLVLATQRPSTNVITGLIKANIPCKIAFMTSSAIDSRVIGCKGAENLSGKGDALLCIAGRKELERVQAFYISDNRLHDFVEHLRQSQPNPQPKPIQKSPQRATGFFKRLFA